MQEDVRSRRGSRRLCYPGSLTMRHFPTTLGRLGALASGLFAVACGGGGTPSGPSEPPVPTYSVTATVFYDQNGNGQLDSSENTRVPGVEVVVGTGTGTSAPGTGIASVTGIREGALTAARPDGKPPGLLPALAPRAHPGAGRRHRDPDPAHPADRRKQAESLPRARATASRSATARATDRATSSSSRTSSARTSRGRRSRRGGARGTAARRRRRSPGGRSGTTTPRTR